MESKGPVVSTLCACCKTDWRGGGQGGGKGGGEGVISKARLSLRRKELVNYKMCGSPAIVGRTNWDWHKRNHHVMGGATCYFEALCNANFVKYILHYTFEIMLKIHYKNTNKVSLITISFPRFGPD